MKDLVFAKILLLLGKVFVRQLEKAIYDAELTILPDDEWRVLNL